jgi:hypothetical protein
MTVTSRYAILSDADMLTRTRLTQLDDEEEHPDTDIYEAVRSWFTENLSNGSLHQVILEEDGRLIATGGLIALPIPPSFFKPQGRNGYILNMYTVPEKRTRDMPQKYCSYCREKRKKQDLKSFISEPPNGAGRHMKKQALRPAMTGWTGRYDKSAENSVKQYRNLIISGFCQSPYFFLRRSMKTS